VDASLYLWSVGQYQKMVEVDILGKYDKVELLEGHVLYKPNRDPPHDGTCMLVMETLRSLCPEEWNIRCSGSVVLSDSVTEPDIAFVRGNHRSYLSRHPGPEDVGLIVEVSSTALARDLDVKARIYARSNIVAYWVIDVPGGVVHVFTQPSGPTGTPAFGSHVVVRAPDAVSLTLDGVAVGPIPATDLLP
jgi:Uma2 family endonuclease